MNNAYDIALEQSDGKTLVVSCGSPWSNETKESRISNLKSTLVNELLDPAFLQYGLYQGSFWRPLKKQTGGLEVFDGATQFFGNFLKCSNCFNIITKSESLMDELKDLTAWNVSRTEFIDLAETMYKGYWLAELNGSLILLEPRVVRSIKLGHRSVFSGSDRWKMGAELIRPFSGDELINFSRETRARA